MSFIKVKNLKAGYDHNAILDGLNFEIAHGDEVSSELTGDVCGVV